MTDPPTYEINMRVALTAESEDEARNSAAMYLMLKGDLLPHGWVQGVGGCDGVVEIEARDA